MSHISKAFVPSALGPGTAGIQPTHTRRLRLILVSLNGATDMQDMNLPGLRPRPLRGDTEGFWEVSVCDTWLVIFRFRQGDAFDVDLVDCY